MKLTNQINLTNDNLTINQNESKIKQQFDSQYVK